MDFNEYQLKARETAIYPNIDKNWQYTIIGLQGEIGELSNKCKKILRDDNQKITEIKREEIKSEVGDIIWYLAMTCCEFGLNFDDVAKENLIKLAKRRQEGKVGGYGDHR